ncbi:hypothetical protein JOB18_019887 [Solea senegalensis]|uniref:Uncharacterized protein n=1 Tax=Solea senegalensis TaxID=28829 RepID=A0AAV6PQG9_SOLSE|nr:hypothetical protein JOB18_019887 [Solea senegalensis]
MATVSESCVLGEDKNLILDYNMNVIESHLRDIRYRLEKGVIGRSRVQRPPVQIWCLSAINTTAAFWYISTIFSAEKPEEAHLMGTFELQTIQIQVLGSEDKKRLLTLPLLLGRHHIGTKVVDKSTTLTM